MSELERIGVSLDKQLLADFDELIKTKGYSNRSEALRDLIRDRLSREKLSEPEIEAVAGVFLVYNHHEAGLSQKLIELQHTHLLHVIATTHVHLDHDDCLEVIIMRGAVGEIEKLANSITCLKGVKLSRMNFMARAGEGHANNHHHHH